MHIDNQFELEAIVYLITDPDQFERMVTRIIVAMGGVLLYELSCGNTTSLHYSGEISSKKDMIIALGLDKNTQ